MTSLTLARLIGPHALWQAPSRMACLICWMDWSLVGVFGSQWGSSVWDTLISSVHRSRFAVYGGAWLWLPGILTGAHQK
jgi:hypothetical protein